MRASSCRDSLAIISEPGIMDCKEAQRLFDDLSRGRLTFELAAEARQHLTDCTDCRVLEQRAARLQRLLALKRYEHPSPEYYENFLTEFHSRLLAETRPRARWWKQALGGIDDFLSAESMQVWRYGLASATSLAVVVGLMWTGLRQTNEFAGSVDQETTANSSLMVTIPHMASADYQLAMADRVDLVPTMARSESTTPQYVLDRISVTPASYDVPNVHF